VVSEAEIGHRADHRDQRDNGGHPLALAIARRHKIGDGGDVLRFRQAHHALHQRAAECDHQHRAEIDRQKIDARADGEAHRAEKRP